MVEHFDTVPMLRVNILERRQNVETEQFGMVPEGKRKRMFHGYNLGGWLLLANILGVSICTGYIQWRIYMHIIQGK